MDDTYLVLIDEEYIRDIQVASDELIDDVAKNGWDDRESTNDEWLDIQGDVSFGIWHAQSLLSAIHICSQHVGINEKALKAYKILGEE